MGLYFLSHNGKPDQVDPRSIIKGEVPDQIVKVKRTEDVVARAIADSAHEITKCSRIASHRF